MQAFPFKGKKKVSFLSSFVREDLNCIYFLFIFNFHTNLRAHSNVLKQETKMKNEMTRDDMDDKADAIE